MEQEERQLEPAFPDLQPSTDGLESLLEDPYDFTGPRSQYNTNPGYIPRFEEPLPKNFPYAPEGSEIVRPKRFSAEDFAAEMNTSFSEFEIAQAGIVRGMLKNAALRSPDENEYIAPIVLKPRSDRFNTDGYRGVQSLSEGEEAFPFESEGFEDLPYRNNNYYSPEVPYGGGPRGRDYDFPYTSPEELRPEYPERFRFDSDNKPRLIEVPEICSSADVINSNFVDTLSPLVAALRGHATYGPEAVARLFANPQGYIDTASRYLVSRDLLGRQRQLTAKETEYLKTVENLSAVNPYIVAAGVAAPEVTDIFLDAEMARRSARSREKLPSGSFVPVAVIGAGVHGTIAAGEILRLRPDLIVNGVFIDKAGTGGGVFAYANGKAHNANSASYVGPEPFKLPDVTDNTLREMAGLFPQFPGERTDPNRGRTGSINRMVPWMVSPDELMKHMRYLTNWHMALMAKEQAALTMTNFMGEMELVKVEPSLLYLSPSGNQRGSLKLTMRDLSQGEDAEDYILYTDNILATTGLGEPKRVVAEDDNFKQIIEAQKDIPGLPYYCNGLEAYRYFADPTREKLEHGRSIAIIGNGDLAATLAEAGGGLFDAINLGEIDQIYIVSESSPNARCRYAALADLLERKTGRKNILKYVEERVNSVAIGNPSGERGDDPAKDGLILRKKSTQPGTAEQIILDSENGIVRISHVIEATGFESRLEEILSPLLGGETLSNSTLNITLPGKPGVVVGQKLNRYPGIAILGTASDPTISDEKLAEYPDSTQEVIKLVGENVVSIGLRGPDTTAGARSWLYDRQYMLPKKAAAAGITGRILGSRTDRRRKGIVDVRGSSVPSVRRTATIDDGLLTPLLLAPIARHRMERPAVSPVRKRKSSRVPVSGAHGHSEYDVEITLGSKRVTVEQGETPIPVDVLDELAIAAGGGHFRAYAAEAMRRRRGPGSDHVKAHLVYTNGKLNLTDSVVQV
jgi:hypothetical protein